MSTLHRECVPEGLECAAYLFDIDDEQYVEFQTSDGLWHSSPYCKDVIQTLLHDGFDKFMKSVDEATCKAHLRRMVTNGPPLYLEDKTFNVPDHLYITKVWFKSDDVEIDAKYRNALEGEEREKLWQHLKTVYECLPEEN